MKTNHREQVAANAALVRHVLERLRQRVPSAPDPAEALAVVEAWLEDGRTTKEELGAVSKAAHETGSSLWGAEEEGAQAASWAWTAVGNLCWMACRERGWTDANRTISDAALYTLTSLDPPAMDMEDRKGQIRRQLALRQELDRLREAALEGALAEAATSGKKARVASSPRFKRPVGLEARLGDVVTARMERLKARIDPRLVGSAKERARTFAALDEPLRRVAEAFDERYGGLVVAELPGDEGRDWLFGAYANLSSGVAPARSSSLVPVASSPNDILFYLDAGGVAWAHDTIEEPEPVIDAPDGDRMVARIVLRGVLFERTLARQVVELEGFEGARIAAELGVGEIVQAGDERWHAWGDARRLVVEERVGDVVRTTIAGLGALRFAASRRSDSAGDG